MARYTWAANIQPEHDETSGATLALEIQADQLLGASAQDDGRGDYPFYTQRWMELLSARERPVDDRLSATPPTTSEPGDRALVARLVVDGQLTRAQRTVIRWMQLGRSQRQIAEAMGVSEPTISRLKQTALARMRTAADRS